MRVTTKGLPVLQDRVPCVMEPDHRFRGEINGGMQDKQVTLSLVWIVKKNNLEEDHSSCQDEVRENKCHLYSGCEKKRRDGTKTCTEGKNL